MSHPAAPGDTGTEAALARLATLRKRLDRVDLQVVVVAPPDAVRQAARDDARTAAITAGRGPLLESAVDEIRAATIQAFARSAYTGTWAASAASASVAGARDRVAVASSFEEAAMAAVVEDLVDEETLDVLRSTTDHLIGLTGMPPPMSLANMAMPAADGSRGPIQIAILLGLGSAGLIVGNVPFAIVGLALGLVVIGAMARWRRP